MPSPAPENRPMDIAPAETGFVAAPLVARISRALADGDDLALHALVLDFGMAEMQTVYDQLAGTPGREAQWADWLRRNGHDHELDHVEDPVEVITSKRIKKVIRALNGERDHFPKFLFSLRAEDLGELMEQLTSDDRVKFGDWLRSHQDAFDLEDTTWSEILSYVEDSTREDLLDSMEAHEIAEVLTELEVDDAVDILEDLEDHEQQEILDALPREEREAIAEGLSYPEDSAGRLMNPDVVAVPKYWTVGECIDWLRSADDLPDEFHAVFVVDDLRKPIGTLRLDSLLRAARQTVVYDVGEDEPNLVPATLDQEEVAHLFRKYDLLTAAVVDEDERLVGVITVDDVIDVIDEEAEEDILRLSGVAESDLNETVLETSKNRFTWLFLNLFTAILASMVISLFDATIEKLVALAVLMPIVASMGGNAGTQTLTIAVRALATRELTASNAARIIWREVLVGGVNGFVFAILMGGAAGLWFADPLLGGVLAMAMIVNMLVAGLAGILIPLGLDYYDIDPAVSGSIFLTTVTDVIGFFAFLGLAAALLT